MSFHQLSELNLELVDFPVLISGALVEADTLVKDTDIAWGKAMRIQDPSVVVAPQSRITILRAAQARQISCRIQQNGAELKQILVKS